jgi:PAS domain S-box-containing protein
MVVDGDGEPGKQAGRSRRSREGRRDAAGLLAVIRRLAVAPTLAETMEIVTQAVRSLMGADGATFVLRDGDLCHYADEDAVAPLWKGRRFPMSACISGWCMANNRAVAIPDIYEDDRIPHDAYRPTFVRSLALAPVSRQEPYAAVGAYWSEPREVSTDEVDLLQTLADASALAISVAQLVPVAEARRAAEAAEARYRAVFDQAAVGVARVSPDGRFLELNDRFCLITNYDRADLLGLEFAEITHPDDIAADLAQVGELLAGASQTYSMEKRYRRKGGGDVWVNLTVSLVRRSDATPDYFISVIEDISERKAAEADRLAHEERLKLLVNELNHRVKNTLTTVQSMAAQTLRGTADPEQAYARLEGRLLALAAAHDILTDRSWGGAALAEVAERTIRPYAAGAPDRLRLAGPQVWLRPQVALALALAFNELATNAVKYGALSTPGGAVDLAWRSGESGQVEIVWCEAGGPPVKPPTRKGFGSRLIERSLSRELGAPVTLDFAPAGLVCRIGLSAH